MSYDKRTRQNELLKLVRHSPLLTDRELAAKLGVSIGTVRLDRALLDIPELRERMKIMAQEATSKLTSLKQEEVIGELLELEPDRWALSMLQTKKIMAFRHTDMVWDHYVFAQANSIAIAVVKAEMVIVSSMRGRFKAHAKVGDSLIARAKVGINKGNKYIISVRTRVGNEEIFVGRFIATSVEPEFAVQTDRSCLV